MSKMNRAIRMSDPHPAFFGNGELLGIAFVLHQSEGGIGKSILDREGLTVLKSILPS